jgi:cytoskeletal protein CcmA (bactofilin family)
MIKTQDTQDIELQGETSQNFSPAVNQGEITALLGKGADFQGRLVFEGIVRIDGNFRGDIFSRDTLIVGADSKVFANIEADTILVAGYVEGELKALSRIEIHSTGYVKGSISTPIFKIEEGGMFDGSTQMLPKDV